MQAQDVILQDGVEITATSYRTSSGLASLLRVRNLTTSPIWWDDEVHNQARSSSSYDMAEDWEVERDWGDDPVMMANIGCDFGPPEQAVPSWEIAPGDYRFHIIRLELRAIDDPEFVASWRYRTVVAKPARSQAPRHSGDWGSMKLTVGYPDALSIAPPPTLPSLLRSREH